MLYESYTCLTFDGKRDYIDLGNCLHRLLHTAELSVDICFSTRHPGYQSLLAVYYKESLLPDFALELHKGAGYAHNQAGWQIGDPARR